MFKLDIYIFNFLYNQCKMLGNALNYGAFEGFIIYLGIFTATTLKVLNNKKVANK